jgi:hypothetical protein
VLGWSIFPRSWSSKRTLPAVVSRRRAEAVRVALPGGPTGDLLPPREKELCRDEARTSGGGLILVAVGAGDIVICRAFLFSLRNCARRSSSILIIGIVGTEAVILINIGSEICFSLSALTTLSVSGLRSFVAAGGVNPGDCFAGRTYDVGPPGETLLGGVFGNTAVEDISGVM